jgi:hypothetical protein
MEIRTVLDMAMGSILRSDWKITWSRLNMRPRNGDTSSFTSVHFLDDCVA